MSRVRTDQRSDGSWRRRGDDGFTLIELLAVIAILSVVVAILIPTVNAARISANKAKSRVQFAQWAAAIEAFRSEYGHYPRFHETGLVNGGATAEQHPFHDVLAGRRRDGSQFSTSDAAAMQNRRRIAFHAFTESDLVPRGEANEGLLRDAFGNTEIAVLVDRNLDGAIDSADYGTLPAVRNIRPTPADFPSAGLRLGMAFYAPTPDATPENPRFVFSWK